MAIIKLENIGFSNMAWYAFNPCYVYVYNLSKTVPTQVTVSIDGGGSVLAQVIGDKNGQSKVDVSGLLHNLWANEDWSDLSRVETIKHQAMMISFGGYSLSTGTRFDLIYGSLNIDESFMFWGNTFKFATVGGNKVKKYTRTAKWYSNLPCELSFVQMFVSECKWGDVNPNNYNEHKGTIEVWQKNTGNWTKWNTSYDCSRTKIHKIASTDSRLAGGGIINIKSKVSSDDAKYFALEADYYYYEDKATNGYYLRWLDNNGMVVYYLFDKGKVTTKTKSIDTSSNEILDNSAYYPAASVDTAREVEVTYKCSATCLDDELYNTIKTIIRANHVQMYVGKSCNDDMTERHVWMPVKLTASQETESEAPKMKSLEVNIIAPIYHSQSL